MKKLSGLLLFCVVVVFHSCHRGGGGNAESRSAQTVDSVVVTDSTAKAVESVK